MSTLNAQAQGAAQEYQCAISSEDLSHLPVVERAHHIASVLSNQISDKAATSTSD